MFVFNLDQRLENDTVFVEDWQLCRVLLMNDRRFPWLILVPRRENIREIYELDAPDRKKLMDEVCRASQVLTQVCAPDKVNVGALGNVVAQLHVHVIGRKVNDAAWPKPVWGVGTAQAYSTGERVDTMEALHSAFKDFK